ncbi:MerR family transcriptional regulator [Actinotalea ferrariae CF5-4]|uniref:MerR family transcriptional regulator n=1 Tax=Actinotalea ferrariae CF5-4 TaxID=948458 RepID=A0A021VRP3_9CELL|nr:GyrI-like domain-containing protein [Actinotalea ferrariae]EYR63811.1 MerR family transcriptional regulator [Actinotalea ferrariae CF5-4]
MNYDIEVVELPPRPAAVVRRAKIRPDDVGAFVATAVGEVMTVVRRQGVLPAGPPFTRYGRSADGVLEVEVGVPTSAPVRDVGRVAAMELPGGRAVRTRHTGPYAGVGAAHEAVTHWMTQHGLAVRDLPWESYLDGPEVPRPRTDVVVPCQGVV